MRYVGSLFSILLREEKVSIVVCIFVLSMLIFIIIVLPQTLGMLEKKESLLLKRAAQEVERAKQFTRAKNKRGKDPKISL